MPRLNAAFELVIPSGIESVAAAAIMLIGAHMLSFPKWHLRLYHSWRGVKDDDLDVLITGRRIKWKIVSGVFVFGMGLAAMIVFGIEGS